MAAPTAPSRPNRNAVWLICLAIAAILVLVLALNSKSTIQSGAQRVGDEPASSSAASGQPPAQPPGQPGG